MRNIHDPKEYHKYKSVTGSNDSGNIPNKGTSDHKPTGLGWVVIVIVIFFLISFISSGADGESISTLLGFGFLAYLLAQWISK